MRRWPSTVFAALIAGALFGAPRTGFAVDPLPAGIRAALLVRTLAYDRKLKDRAGSVVGIGIVFKAGNPESESAAKEITVELEALAKRGPIAGIPAKIVNIPFGPKFEVDSKAAGAVALYVCPGLDGAAEMIAKAARTNSMVAFSASESYVDAGLPIAFVLRNGKAAIVIGLKSAEAEGADLDGALLRIADVRK